MINDVLNSCVPAASCGTDNVDKRLDALEAAQAASSKAFSSENISATTISAGTGNIEKINANAVDTTSLKAQSINVENLDIDGPINMNDITVSNAVNAKTGNFDMVDSTEVQTINMQAHVATIDNLIVGQVTAKDNNTLVNDLTVNGTATIDTLVLGNPHVASISTETSESVTSNITNGNIKHIAGVDDAKIKDIILDGSIIKGGSIKINMLKSLNEDSMQIGDDTNQVVIAGLSRPLWNDKVIATLDDLGDKIVPSYKGRIATEAFLPENGTLGDYYIITMLTKGDKAGIGFALYNGTKFDTDFFYELEGYRLSADQDIIDEAQNTSIENEIERAKVTENNLFENGVRKVQAKTIAGNNLNIDLLFGAEHFGERYTGFGKNFIDGVVPNGEENVGCSLDILPNSHNTVQIMTTNHPTEARVFIRSYGNNIWTEWKKVATSSDKVADSERLEGHTLIELRQMLFNDSHPVGDTFVSNDGNDDPNTIYNRNGITSIWTYVGQSFGIHGWRRTE